MQTLEYVLTFIFNLAIKSFDIRTHNVESLAYLCDFSEHNFKSLTLVNLGRRHTAAVEHFPERHSPRSDRGHLPHHDRDPSLASDPSNHTDRIKELEELLNSESHKSKVYEEEMNTLRQQVKKLQEEVSATRKMYEECENEKKRKAPDPSVTKKIKDLLHELQILKSKNVELLDRMAATERKMSELSDRKEELRKERTKMAEKYKSALKGKMKFNL
jgi:hypothetical protein